MLLLIRGEGGVGGGGIVHFLTAYTGCVTGQGMVWGLSIMNRVYSFRHVFPKQGQNVW